ncbi:methylated-DNA--[protein]-cysteine S-methyltransferase [Collinsella tanakaei]|uniref:methylated-DNA--[protein]-cysteine S-methyltransferase n=1 Tax=Collinsella tanakaei TaxID=626935 RepID=UPI0019580854|nr:methylated-DNA--[protein]-cysteine S-methyltransferase [Collinsella tanakaei]MBM6755515.1 methylated-DNA--[protein]-cysteine S-methyltransferase [Collinsella tanakaei]
MLARTYDSPLGSLVLAADGTGLAGVWFEGQRHFGEFGSPRRRLDDRAPGPLDAEDAACALDEAGAWLDRYFTGATPLEAPRLHLIGSGFQLHVWDLLLKIPFGQTTTYGELARELERRYGGRASARAVGGAVGRNPVSIIVPCHRVVGSDGLITGYAGGVERKRALLALEGVRLDAV